MNTVAILEMIFYLFMVSTGKVSQAAIDGCHGSGLQLDLKAPSVIKHSWKQRHDGSSWFDATYRAWVKPL